MISIQKDCLQTSTAKEFQELLVHEIVHLLFDPIAAEHEFQMQFSSDKSHLDENRIRFRRTLEQQVERTALIMCAAFGQDAPIKEVLGQLKETV